MDRDKDLTDAVLKRAKLENGTKKLNCAEAFELAKSLDAQIAVIGRICNEQNIKICNCQLGCFK